MDRQDFRERLHTGLQTVLVTKVEQHLDRRFTSHEQLLRYVSALGRKRDTGDAVKQGFSSIFKNIEDTITKEDADDFLACYLDAVDEITRELPEQVTWPQNEDRFVTNDGDSGFIKIAKTVKRTSRSVLRLIYKAGQQFKGLFGGSVKTYPQWRQQIPLQRVVVFYLMDEEFISKILQDVQRVQLRMINDIEDFLVSNGIEQEKVGVEELISSEKNMLEQKKNQMLQTVSDFADQKESDIAENAEKIGTVEQRPARFAKPRLDEIRKELVEEYQTDKEQWQEMHRLFVERTKDVAQFLNLKVELGEEIRKFKETYHQLFDSHFNQPLTELQDMLQHAIKQVHDNDSVEGIDLLKDELGMFVRTKLIEPNRQLLEKRVLSEKAEHFFEDLLLSVRQSSEHALIIFDADLEKNPPKVDQKEVAWRELVIRALREQLINGLQPADQQYEDFLDQNLGDIREIENIISVNLESAFEAKEEDMERAEDATSVAEEALERIAAKVKAVHDRTSEKWTAIEQHITEGEEHFYTSLLSLLHEGDLKELQLLNAKYKVKETTKGWRTVLDSRWAAVQERLLIWSRFLGKKGKKYLLRAKQVFGFKDEEVQEAKRADIAGYLSETDQKMKELPYIYRQLFDFHTAADKRFNVTSQESIQTFKKAFGQWQKPMPALFAVVGEKGSGKSSFIDLMVDEQLDGHVTTTIEFEDTIWTEEQLVKKISKEFDIKEVQNIDELISEINKSVHREVVVLESVQNCFVRNMNGFEAIEKLCYLLTETRENLFWMVSCSRYAWAFLDEVMQISEYFSHVAKSDALNAEQIEEVILNRHRASGYSLYFEADEEIQQSRNFRKLKGDETKTQEHLRENYFEKLTELAEGNASVAIIFWIRSIRDFDDTHFYIKPLEVTKVEMLDNLSNEVLFTLAAFVLHDTLLDSYLSMVLNNTYEESRLMINRLGSRGLLEKKGELYTINHLMYRQIVRELKERNIIHLV